MCDLQLHICNVAHLVGICSDDSKRETRGFQQCSSVGGRQVKVCQFSLFWVVQQEWSHEMVSPVVVRGRGVRSFNELVLPRCLSSGESKVDRKGNLRCTVGNWDRGSISTDCIVVVVQYGWLAPRSINYCCTTRPPIELKWLCRGHVGLHAWWLSRLRLLRHHRSRRILLLQKWVFSEVWLAAPLLCPAWTSHKKLLRMKF
jgi:hypothetical protein